MSTKKPRAAKAKPAPEPAEPYKPTEYESKLALEMIERRKTAPSVKFDVTDDGGNNSTVNFAHPEPAIGAMLLMDAFGTTNERFSSALVTQLANITSMGGKVDGHKLNGAVAMVTGINPNDEVEAMLASQMTAVHNATISAATRLNNADMLNQYEVYSRTLTKLARTFAAQVEALKKYRSSGEQSIRVQHVNVTAEQAIVGNVQTGGGGASPEKERQPHELDAATPPSLTYAPGTPMFSNVETLRPALQGAGDERLGCVPLPRREGRSA